MTTPAATRLLGSILATLCLAAGGARAESSLRLPYPTGFGSIPAATYDEDYRRVGDAQIAIENLEDGRVQLVVASGIDGGARTIARAEFAVVGDSQSLKLLRQESRSFDTNGVALGVLSIDHVNGVGSCAAPDGDDMHVEKIALPAHDRVANVPLNLLFQPLVDGTTKEVEFQVLLCRFGPRLVDIDAKVVPQANDSTGSLVEVEYVPNLGGFVSTIAQRWLPRLSVWFDGARGHDWVAHRVPLYSKGPNVFVIREGVPSSWLSH
jgi:hypothetical protein